MKKTVLITGASSGIGKATAKLFIEQGWNVIAAMRSPEKETELNELNNVLIVKLDVQSEEEIHKAIQDGIQHFGKIDALVNSAGYGLIGVFESATLEQIRKQYEINVFGLMRTSQAVLSHFRVNGSGTIINISSFGGITAGSFASLYNSSKFAVEGFSEALSHEVAPLGISVKIIEPGSIATNFRNGMDLIKNDIETYSPLFTSMLTAFAQKTAHLKKSTVEDVAHIIFEAATDDTTRLRYVAGDDAQYYIDLKMQNTEENLIAAMR